MRSTIVDDARARLESTWIATGKAANPHYFTGPIVAASNAVDHSRHVASLNATSVAQAYLDKCEAKKVTQRRRNARRLDAIVATVLAGTITYAIVIVSLTLGI